LTGISGNKEIGSQISIIHENIENQPDLGPYRINAVVKGIHRYSDLKVKLYYNVNNKDYQILDMQSSSKNPNKFFADIPTQAPDSNVSYFISIFGDDVLVSSQSPLHNYYFYIEASPESNPSNDEIVAMIIMMIIILGFFWGGFAYTARLALIAERRKLHDYYFEEEPEQTITGRVEYNPEY
jgi:hypothetical protein